MTNNLVRAPVIQARSLVLAKLGRIQATDDGLVKSDDGDRQDYVQNLVWNAHPSGANQIVSLPSLVIRMQDDNTHDCVLHLWFTDAGGVQRSTVSPELSLSEIYLGECVRITRVMRSPVV